MIKIPEDSEPDEFRRLGHAAVDWVADYLERLPGLPPLSQAKPGALVAALPGSAPIRGEAMETVLADLEQLIPGITHWGHPRFFAYFNSSGSTPAILGELITAGLNVNAMLWRTSPSATELEYVVCRWLARLLGLPDSFDGHINDTASVSTLVALAGAREALGREIGERGLGAREDLPQLRVYASDQAHSSVEKAVITLGLGRRGFCAVESDAAYRMLPAALEREIAADLSRDQLPCAVVATVGTTASTSIDPVPELAQICRRHGIWLHLDGAHGGAMAVVPEYRSVLAGAELADSLVVNPHKWLFTQLDCSVLFTARPEVLRQAFSVVPEYLRSPGEEMAARNLMDFGVALGRRMRALKLWFVLRHFGQEGLAERIREHVQMAGWLAEAIRAEDAWELCAPVPMATVCFRHHPRAMGAEAELADHNRRLMDRVNRGGRVFISHAELKGRLVLRASIGSVRTRPADVEELWRELRSAAS